MLQCTSIQVDGTMKTLCVVTVLLFLIAVIGAESKAKENSRILNGQDSDIIPYQVKINICGGTLIKLDWVLTARHCLGSSWRRIHFTPNAQTVWADFSNSSNLENGQKREVAVDSIILLDSTEKIEDLALLRIDPPFEESDTVKPIQVNDIHENLVGQEILISGWGTTTTGYPGQLQKLLMNITSQGEGIPMGNWVEGDMVINMNSSKGEGACYGDSGGNQDE